MRRRLMAGTAAVIIVGFLAAFALAAKFVQDQYRHAFTQRLHSVLVIMKLQMDDIERDPQRFAVTMGGTLQENEQEIRITILDPN